MNFQNNSGAHEDVGFWLVSIDGYKIPLFVSLVSHNVPAMAEIKNVKRPMIGIPIKISTKISIKGISGCSRFIIDSYFVPFVIFHKYRVRSFDFLSFFRR